MVFSKFSFWIIIILTLTILVAGVVFREKIEQLGTIESGPDYYAIVDVGLERVHAKRGNLRGRRPGANTLLLTHEMIAEEFNIEYTPDIAIEAAKVYREANGIEPNGDIPIDLRREHIKLLLEFPEKTNGEIIERLKNIER